MIQFQPPRRLHPGLHDWARPRGTAHSGIQETRIQVDRALMRHHRESPWVDRRHQGMTMIWPMKMNKTKWIMIANDLDYETNENDKDDSTNDNDENNFTIDTDKDFTNEKTQLILLTRQMLYSYRITWALNWSGFFLCQLHVVIKNWSYLKCFVLLVCK
jgi:hypothetical protein